MTRVGREPAEDVKRRIVTACQEAGLLILSARMVLRHEYEDRVICVWAASPDRPFEQAAIEVMTIITLRGHCSGNVHIRCAACEKDSDPHMVWETPVMTGRSVVPLDELVEALRKTREEQEQVIAAMKMGVDGPYVFADTTWARPNDILGQP